MRSIYILFHRYLLLIFAATRRPHEKPAGVKTFNWLASRWKCQNCWIPLALCYIACPSPLTCVAGNPRLSLHAVSQTTKGFRILNSPSKFLISCTAEVDHRSVCKTGKAEEGDWEPEKGAERLQRERLRLSAVCMCVSRFGCQHVVCVCVVVVRVLCFCALRQVKC